MKLAMQGEAKFSEEDTSILAALDGLLRFYVVLCGIRKGGQIPDTALKICYRYWLAQCFCSERVDLRRYVEHFFPALGYWLAEDERLKNSRRFFSLKEFGSLSQRQRQMGKPRS